MLKKLRVLFAVVMGAVITFYFLDFAGLTTGWPNLARIQFVPALLAGSFGIVLILLVATLLFGRIYCSVICPLGVFQDAISWVSGKRKKNRFRYSPAMKWLRYGVLAVFIIAMIVGSVSYTHLTLPTT